MNQIIDNLRRPLRELNRYRKRQMNWLYVNYPLGEKAFVLGTPTHTNIGDSAIAIAEINFLQRHLKRKMPIKEMTVQETYDSLSLLHQSDASSCYFFGMGEATWVINGIRKNFFDKGVLLTN